jgi:chromate transport protein ChrA
MIDHSVSLSSTKVSFKTALKFWTKLGFISFGGPAGQIAIMHQPVVVAVVIEAVLRIGKKALKHGVLYAFAAIAFVAIFSSKSRSLMSWLRRRSVVCSCKDNCRRFSAGPPLSPLAVPTPY